MTKRTHSAEEDAFAALFEAAEERPAYWIESAKIEFTEEVIARMKELGMTKSQLAEKLAVQPGMVTRIVSGQNNFELATMVKIARALGCEFRSHLQRPGRNTEWMEFLDEEPGEASESEQPWDSTAFKQVERLQLAEIAE